jgi:Sporulation and spore germination
MTDHDAPQQPSADAGPPPPDRWSARPVVRISQRNVWIIGSIVGALLALGIWLVIAKLPQVLTTPEGGAPAQAPQGAATDARRIHATLFSLSDDGEELVPATREVLYGATPAEQARRIVEAVVQAPPQGTRPVVPVGTVVRSVFLTSNGQAYVDLGGTIVSGQPGGSLDELLAVYAIVNAVTVNLPDISAVQILVDGKQVDALAGHIDLRYPLGKSLDWVKKGT